jgi:hypothetical protein
MNGQEVVGGGNMRFWLSSLNMWLHAASCLSDDRNNPEVRRCIVIACVPESGTSSGTLVYPSRRGD